MDFLDIYFSYVKMFIKSRMEYRFSFFSGMLANFYCYFITYTTFWVITSKFTAIAGWSFEDMSILYGLNLLTYSLAGTLFWYTVFHLENEITTGNLDSYLIRPIGLIKQMMCRRFGDTFIGQIIVTLFFMAAAVININYRLTVWSWLYLIMAVFGGVLIQSGAMIILGSLSFWTLHSTELSDIVYYGIRNFVHYPLSIFPGYIRIILTYIFPWALINYYPSLIILRKVQTAEEFVLGIFSPVLGILFFLLSIFVFNRGLRKYTGSGS
ncbi:MAG: ABC-2 family transporter protein [Treponema sp.]|nr:ABC-2 family transporter protein [Treponema sp.]